LASFDPFLPIDAAPGVSDFFGGLFGPFPTIPVVIPRAAPPTEAAPRGPGAPVPAIFANPMNAGPIWPGMYQAPIIAGPAETAIFAERSSIIEQIIGLQFNYRVNLSSPFGRLPEKVQVALMEAGIEAADWDLYRAAKLPRIMRPPAATPVAAATAEAGPISRTLGNVGRVAGPIFNKLGVAGMIASGAVQLHDLLRAYLAAPTLTPEPFAESVPTATIVRTDQGDIIEPPDFNVSSLEVPALPSMPLPEIVPELLPVQLPAGATPRAAPAALPAGVAALPPPTLGTQLMDLAKGALLGTAQGVLQQALTRIPQLPINFNFTPPGANSTGQFPTFTPSPPFSFLGGSVIPRTSTDVSGKTQPQLSSVTNSCVCTGSRAPKRVKGECGQGYFRERPDSNLTEFIYWSHRKCPSSSQARQSPPASLTTTSLQGPRLSSRGRRSSSRSG